MTSFSTRLARLETQSVKAERLPQDDEIVEALKSGTYKRRHIDALFRIIEPALLGYLIISAKDTRPMLDSLLGAWQRPCFPMEAAGWLVAAGNGVTTIVDSDLAWWEEQFHKPIDESSDSHDEKWRVWDAHEELIKRLLHKHGLETMRSIVRAICDASGDEREELIDRFVPRADEARRMRMSRISAPLRPFIGWDFNPFPLIVLAPDANRFWYIEDNTGQEWTPARR